MFNRPQRLALAALSSLMLQAMPALANDDLRQEIAAQKARLEALEKRLLEAEKARVEASAAAAAAPKPAAKPATPAVTMYGIADVGLELGDYGHGQNLRLQSGLGSASRFGFRGERSFNDDLSGYFQLEMGVSFDVGQNTGHSSNVSNPGGGSLSAATPNTTGVAIFSRNTFAGLRSKAWGDLRVGRDYAPAYNITTVSDPFTIGGATAFRLWSSASLSRMDNAVFYTSPTLEGFRASLAYSAGMENNSDVETGNSGGALLGASSTGPRSEGKGFGANLTFTQGPLFLGVGLTDYRRMGDVKPPATENTRRKGWNVAATYDLGEVKLYAHYLHGEDTQAGLVNPKLLKRNIWWLGASGEVAKGHTLRAVVSRLDDQMPVNRDSTHLGLGYEYALDKQADLYVYYARVSNQNGGQNSLCAGGTCQGYDKDSGLPANFAPRSIMTGLRYRF